MRRLVCGVFHLFGMRGRRSLGKEESRLYEKGMTLASWPAVTSSKKKVKEISTAVEGKGRLTFLWVSYHVAFPQYPSVVSALLPHLQHTPTQFTPLDFTYTLDNEQSYLVIHAAACNCQN